MSVSPESASTPATNDDDLTTERVLDLIEWEITTAHERHSASAWTRPGAIALLGYLAWLLLSEIEVAYPDWHQVLAAAVLASTLLDAAFLASRLVSPSSAPGQRRFWFLHDWVDSASSTLAATSRDVALLAAVVFVVDPAHGITTWLAVAFFGVPAGGAAVLLAALSSSKLSRIALPRTPKPVLLRIRNAIGLLVAIGLSTSLAVQLPWSAAPLVAEAMRVGGVAAALLFVLTALPRLDRAYGDSAKLNEIRRDLALGRTSAANAARAARIELDGMDAPEVLRPHADRLRDALQTVLERVSSWDEEAPRDVDRMSSTLALLDVADAEIEQVRVLLRLMALYSGVETDEWFGELSRAAKLAGALRVEVEALLVGIPAPQGPAAA